MKDTKEEILKDFIHFLHLEGFMDINNNHIDKFLKRSQFISGEIVEGIKYIHSFFKGEVVFCGSLGLVLNGLLERKINDIDVLTFENHYRATTKREAGSSGRFEVNNEYIECFKFPIQSIPELKVDVMYKESKIDFVKMEFEGIIINVESPIAAIKAKKYHYAHDDMYLQKHEEDLVFIKNKMDL